MTEFTLQSILDVLKKVGSSAAYWRELGRRLKPDLDLDSIEADHHRVDRCLEEVVAKWKRDGDNPSWKTLAEVVSLCKEGGGKNVAFMIRKETGLGVITVLVSLSSFVGEYTLSLPTFIAISSGEGITGRAEPTNPIGVTGRLFIHSNMNVTWFLIKLPHYIYGLLSNFVPP